MSRDDSARGVSPARRRPTPDGRLFHELLPFRGPCAGSGQPQGVARAAIKPRRPGFKRSSGCGENAGKFGACPEHSAGFARALKVRDPQLKNQLRQIN